MANMKHKSPSERKGRRDRYINAIEPFRKQFNCTAAEVHGIVNGIMNENVHLKEEVAKLKAELSDTKAALKVTEGQLEMFKLSS